MSIKIAIVATDFLADFIEDRMQKLKPEFEYKLFLYRGFRDIRELFLTIPEDFEGVMTSGIFPAMVIQRTFPEHNKILSYFNSDDAGICRLFLNLYKENRDLNLKRIYADFADLIGAGLESYLLVDPRRTLNNAIDESASQMSLEDLYKVEEEHFNKHLRLYRQGFTDLSVTRFSSIILKLRAAGVRTYFPYPSFSYLETLFSSLVRDISLRQLQGARPAAVNVSIEPPAMQGHNQIAMQQQFLLLQAALTKFFGSSTLDYVVQRNHFGYEVLTDKKRLEEYTERFTVCKLSEYLAANLNFTVFIGYGIGKDIYQARMNAANAVRESSIEKTGSFLMDENEELTGHLGNSSISVSTASRFGDSYRVTGLSPLSVNKVLAALRSMPYEEITAGELGKKLNLTSRSANRFLSAMERAGVLTICGEKRPTTKGRPERVYKLCENTK